MWLQCLQRYELSWALPLRCAHVQGQRFCQEGRNDPTQQVAPEDGRGPQVRLPESDPDGWLQWPVHWLHPQQEADPLPLHPEWRLRQGLHQHLRRPDALQLPQEGQCHPEGGLPQVQRRGGLWKWWVHLQGPEDNSLPLQQIWLSIHIQEQGRYGWVKVVFLIHTLHCLFFLLSLKILLSINCTFYEC